MNISITSGNNFPKQDWTQPESPKHEPCTYSYKSGDLVIGTWKKWRFGDAKKLWWWWYTPKKYGILVILTLNSWWFGYVLLGWWWWFLRLALSSIALAPRPDIVSLLHVQTDIRHYIWTVKKSCAPLARSFFNTFSQSLGRGAANLRPTATYFWIGIAKIMLCVNLKDINSH